MQSIEQTKAIINQSTPAVENKIKYSNKPEPKNYFVRLPGHEREIKEQYFKHFRSYKTYYKAKVTTFIIKNYYTYDEVLKPVQGGNKIIAKNERIIKEFKIYLLTSYNTEIAIYNSLDGNLYLNANYYNCSSTTTNQLDHFIKYLNYNLDESITNKYYLNSENWNHILKELKDDHIRSINKIIPGKIELDANLKQPIFNIMFNNGLSQHEKAIKILESINYFEPQYINQHFIKHDTTRLKSRIRHNIILRINGVELELQYSSRIKNHKKAITKYKIKLVPGNIYFKYDLRTASDKKLYDGYDIGITNTKELKKQTFKKSKCLYYGF